MHLSVRPGSLAFGAAIATMVDMPELVPAARRHQPPRDELLTLTDEVQIADFRAALQALSVAWAVWRGQPGFQPGDDVPPRSFAPAPSRYRKPKPPTKGERIAAAQAAIAEDGITVEQTVEVLYPMFGLWWSNTAGPAFTVAEQVEQLRWLWLRSRNVADARYEAEHGKPAWLRPWK